MIKNIVFHFDTLKMTPIPVTWHFLPPTYIFTQFKTNMLNIQAALKKWFVILETFPDLPSCTDFDIINTTSNVRKLKKKLSYSQLVKSVASRLEIRKLLA